LSPLTTAELELQSSCSKGKAAGAIASQRSSGRRAARHGVHGGIVH